MRFDFKMESENWLEMKKQEVKESTLAAYRLIIERYLWPYFGNPIDLDEGRIQDFVNEKMSEGLSGKTIKDILTVLRMFLKYVGKKGFGVPEGFQVRYPREKGVKELPVLTVKQECKLIDYLTGDLTHRNLGILICLHTGIRIGEACALRWDDIDLCNGRIRIEKTLSRLYICEGGHGKTELRFLAPKTRHSFRSVPMSGLLIEIIRERFKIMEGCYVLSGGEKPIEPRCYRNYYHKVMEMLGLPRMRFHGLRHSFATRCIESNCDYKTVSEILGHSDISTTLNLYVHPSMEQKKRCIEKMLRWMEK